MNSVVPLAPKKPAPRTLSPRRPRADARLNRDAIIAAAQAVLARDPHASIDLIARTAELSRRAVYGHFPDRDSLVRAVIARGAERFNAIADAVATSATTPAAALAALGAGLWREAASVQASVALALDAEHVAGTAAALAPLRARLRQISADGIAAGVFRGDADAEQLAQLIEATARGVLLTVAAGTVAAGTTGEGAVGEGALANGTLAVSAMLGVAGLDWRASAKLLARGLDLDSTAGPAAAARETENAR